MPQPVRRVVTGHGTGNVAKVLFDGPANNVFLIKASYWFNP